MVTEEANGLHNIFNHTRLREAAGLDEHATEIIRDSIDINCAGKLRPNFVEFYKRLKANMI